MLFSSTRAATSGCRWDIGPGRASPSAHGPKLLVHQVARFIELGDAGFGSKKSFGLERAERTLMAFSAIGRMRCPVKLARTNHVTSYRILDQ